MAADLPPNHQPADVPTVTDPRLIELCFQAAGVWEIGTTGILALPLHVDRVIPGDRTPGRTRRRSGGRDQTTMAPLRRRS